MAASLGLGLAGCAQMRRDAAPAVVSSSDERAVKSGDQPVEPALSEALETAPGGVTVRVSGSEGAFVLGPRFDSARGVPCRIGRPERASAEAPIHAFCRMDGAWRAVRPVLLSGS